MEPQHMIQIGEPARNVTLKDQNDATFDLFEQSGKWLLLSFHPLAWTPVCTDQMKSLEKNYDIFTSLNTVAVGLSVDSVPCKKAWAKDIGVVRTPLLCDFWPHGHVAQTYGLFRDSNGFSERANVIIDDHKNVKFVKIYPLHNLPDIEEIISFLRQHKEK